MKNTAGNIVKAADRILSRGYLKFFKERNSLIIFLLHGLFRDKKEIALNHVNPQSQRDITVEHFRQFVEYYLSVNYIFISPVDILNGLNNDKNYIMITFDDGYFSNQYALPVLKEYKIPAVFFISANHIKYNKCFWGDILYRERIKTGTSKKDILRESKYLKSKTNDEMEKYLIDIFGKNALKPISDIDRPFTPSELKEFSKEKYVFLGNHTCDHAILPNYPQDEIRSQICDAQNYIYDITRIKPEIIAYPNGVYSKEVVRISRELGLKYGITIEPKKNYLPLNMQGEDTMLLGRFSLWGNNTLIRQCETARSDIVLYNTLRIFLNNNYKN